MDDSTNEIKRNELLKLGGIGALAAVAALIAESGPAEADSYTSKAKPKASPAHEFGNNPIGLDVVIVAASNAKPAKAGVTASTKVVVTGDIDNTAGATIVYTIATPSVKGHLPHGKDHDDPKLKGTAYIAVWY